VETKAKMQIKKKSPLPLVKEPVTPKEKGDSDTESISSISDSSTTPLNTPKITV